MGFDTWGSTRPPRPPKPTTDAAVVADLAKRQRADDRRLPGASNAGRAQDFGSYAVDSTYITNDPATSWTIPTSHARYAVVASVQIAAASGDTYDGDLYDGVRTSSGQATGRVSGDTGFTCHLLTTGGSTVSMTVEGPDDVSAVVLFSCYPTT